MTRAVWEDVKWDVSLCLGLLAGAITAAILRHRNTPPGGTT